MGKYPIKPGCLPNSLSFPDVFRFSAFVFPQKRFLRIRPIGNPYYTPFFRIFVLPTEEGNSLFSADILLYAHLPQNLWGTKFVPSRHKEKRQTEIDLTTVFFDSKFEMIFRQVLLYIQHLRVNLVWKIAADYFVKNMI